MTRSHQARELKNTGYELFILLLSVLSIFNLLFLFVPRLDPVVKDVIRIADAFITILFMADFLYRFFSTESKRDYFFRNWGWADLLASVPVQQLKIFRLFRVVRVLHLMRQFGLRNIVDEILHDRASSALYLTVFLVIVVLEFGGMGIVFAEAGNPDANIKTAADGVWWAFVTITTVGYGDRYPVTSTGRLVGMLTMILGVGLFGVLTGFLANAFLSPREKPAPAGVEAAPAEAQISEFRRLLEEQERVNAALREKLAGIEAVLSSAPTTD